jgi:hypothetical protein
MENKSDIDVSLNSAKRLKLDSSKSLDLLPSSVIAAFTNQDGVRAGPPIEIPVQSTTKQLEILVNTLLENNENVSLFLTIVFGNNFIIKCSYLSLFT